ncbi:MAG: LLM class flavin-dependent oxidoreductase [Proteobacteria bacterium]|nr:LLM class flavin-dependent oxidoreductase [Pseudomonadota bacterium]
MKFMFFSEGETLPGESYQIRYWDLIEQVIHAEHWGFDSFGVSEQQYAIGGISTSCPEVLYGYLFALTKTLRFAHAITLLPKNINHALRIASRTAVQDVLSRGRIELGVGRGNTTLALRAFEVDLEKNRSEVNEGIQILQKAFTEDPFMFYGEHYNIPPRSLVPKPIQTPYPPLHIAATSPESHIMAAELGVGVYSWSNFMGYDALAESLSAYHKAAEKTAATGKFVNQSAGALLQGYCAETDEIAREEAGEGNVKWLQIALDGYPRLAKMAESYSYMAKVQEVSKKATNLDYFQEGSGAAVFGSPESCIRSIEKLRDCGVDTLILRIDSVPHDKIMKSIEMFGRHVIPHFKAAKNFMRPAEDVMADIRTMRDKAKEMGVYVEGGEKPAKAPKTSAAE